LLSPFFRLPVAFDQTQTHTSPTGSTARGFNGSRPLQLPFTLQFAGGISDYRQVHSSQLHVASPSGTQRNTEVVVEYFTQFNSYLPTLPDNLIPDTYPPWICPGLTWITRTKDWKLLRDTNWGGKRHAAHSRSGSKQDSCLSLSLGLFPHPVPGRTLPSCESPISRFLRTASDHDTLAWCWCPAAGLIPPNRPPLPASSSHRRLHTYLHILRYPTYPTDPTYILMPCTYITSHTARASPRSRPTTMHRVPLMH